MKQDRKDVLLMATVELLGKMLDSGDTSETAFYDEADCDGYCLIDDIKAEIAMEKASRTEALREDAFDAKREQAREECAAELAGDRMRLERMNGERDNNWNQRKDTGI